MQVVQPVQPVLSNLNISPELEARRRSLQTLGTCLIIAGVFSLCTFWSTYYYGFILSVGSIVTGYMQIQRARTQEAMVLVAARTTWGTLQTMNYVGCILAFIGLICAAYAAYVWATWWYGGMTLWLICAIVGAIADLFILICAAMSAQKCGDMHREIIVLVPGYGQQVVAAAGVAAAGVAAGGYAAMPQQGQQQQAYGQPATGSPMYGAQQQQCHPGGSPYGQPQPGAPAYGQPQPGAPAPGAYGQPQPAPYGQPAPDAYPKTAAAGPTAY